MINDDNIGNLKIDISALSVLKEWKLMIEGPCSIYFYK